MTEEINNLEKRLIQMSNSETYTADEAIKKATDIFNIASELSRLIAETHTPVSDSVKKLIKECLNVRD